MHAFSRLAHKRYTPRWMYLVSGLLHILDGVLDIILLPFEYNAGFSGIWAEKILRRAMAIRKEESDVHKARKDLGTQR